MKKKHDKTRETNKVVKLDDYKHKNQMTEKKNKAIKKAIPFHLMSQKVQEESIAAMRDED
ncbi:hypothetical protein [Paenibacillus illinoisensis]|uniref:hypothetical protein n=1 Tax=Paenibacillus illinoisensis TaxID=59845 RepID=UPI00301766C5